MVTLFSSTASAFSILVLFSHTSYFINGESLYGGSQCKLKDGRPGICENITSCKSIDEALRKRTLPLKDLVICFFIRTTEYICCPDNVATLPSTTPLIMLFDFRATKKLPGTSNTLKPTPFLNVSNFTSRATDEVQENYIDLTKQLNKDSFEHVRFKGISIPTSPIYDPALIFSNPNSTNKRITARVRDMKNSITESSRQLTTIAEPLRQNNNAENISWITPRRPYWSTSNWFRKEENKSQTTEITQIPVFRSTKQIQSSTVKFVSTSTSLNPGMLNSDPAAIFSTKKWTISSNKKPITSAVLDLWMVNILREASTTSSRPVGPTSSMASNYSDGFFISPQEVNVNTTSTPTPKETSAGQPSSRAGERKAEKACLQFQTDYLKFPRPLDYHILDGEPAFLGEFPHMAALGYPSEEQGQSTVSFDCGGSLVSDQFVLTAAHCVNRPERRPIIIRLGTVDISEPSAEQFDVGIQNIILHPDYRSSRQHHDIALIRLNTSLVFNSSTIYPACLHTDRSDIEADVALIATGWGSTSTATRKKSDVLLKVNLTSVDWPDCNAKYLEYGQMRKLPNGLNEGQLCAIDPNNKKDTCEGDSGGPLQIAINNKMSTVIGITSFGIDCASSIPSVYARVAFYLDWLESYIWPDV